MSFTCNAIWPMRIDLSSLECRQILREKELLCYSDVVSVLRAQGPITEEKKTLLSNLQKVLSISEERNKAELRRAANNEKLATIAETVSGFDGYTEWTALGALKFPPTLRPTPRTIFCDQASQTTISSICQEKDFPVPMETEDIELTDLIDKAIGNNRYVTVVNNKNIDPRTAKSHRSTMTPLSLATIDNNPIAGPKDSSSAHNYNLHLLSEIATVESTQSERGTLIPGSKDHMTTETVSSRIDSGFQNPTTFASSAIGDRQETIINNQSLQHQLHHTTNQSNLLIPGTSRHHVMVPLSSSSLSSSNAVVMTTYPVKTSQQPVPSLGIVGHQELNSSGSVVNSNSVNVPMIISNSAGQRYMLPRNALSSNTISVGAGTNTINQPHLQQQKGSILSSQPIPTASSLSSSVVSHSNSSVSSNGYIQLRLPQTSTHHLSSTNQPQQVYIQNIGHGTVGGSGAGSTNVLIPHNHNQTNHHHPQHHHQSSAGMSGMGSSEFSSTNSFSYALKQRSMVVAKDEHVAMMAHQQNRSSDSSASSIGAHSINNKLVVRNLGSAALSTESERNKRFMVIKGNSGTGSSGPTVKKPKMSNPSNRQPGRPPLMAAPSSAYTNRPYVANEIFHNNRSSTTTTTAVNATSSISSDHQSAIGADSVNGGGQNLKISSVSSGSRGPALTINSSSSFSSHAARTNSYYYSINRGGNGLQLSNNNQSSSVTVSNSRDSNKDPIIQLGTGSQIISVDSGRSIAVQPGVSTTASPGAGSLGTGGPISVRTKNIHPLYSVVPLSPRGGINTADVNSLHVPGNTIKEDKKDHNVLDKNPVSVPYRIITKDEVYSNIMDRNNAPSIVSLSQAENKVLQ